MDAVNSKDTQIMALTTNVQELESGNTAKVGGHFLKWWINNVSLIITRDSKL